MFFVVEQITDTQQMLENISRSFIMQTSLIVDNWVLWLVALILGLFVLAIVLAKKKTPVAYFITHNASFTKRVLEQAVEEHTLCDVQIEAIEQVHTIAMKIVSIEDKTLQLCSSKENPFEDTTLLVDKKIRATLLHTVKKGEQGYYMLSAKIVDATVVDSFLQLTVVLLYNIEKIQRREHLRIEPKDEDILGIALWSEQLHNNIFVNKPEQWGDPEYKYIPGKITQVQLMNISASGAKMLIGVDSTNPKLTLDKKCIMLIDIWEPELEQKIRYWIRCVEQNTFKIKDKNAIEIGVRFKEWTTTPLHDDSLHFIPISKYGEIPPLANWIMKRYLEQYKDISASQSTSESS